MIRLILAASLLGVVGAGAYKITKPQSKAATVSCCVLPPCPPECGAIPPAK